VNEKYRKAQVARAQGATEKNTLATEDTTRRSRNQKPLATEGTEITEPKIKPSKQKGFQNPHSSLSTVFGGEGRARGKGLTKFKEFEW